MNKTPRPRFMTLHEVATELAISHRQVYQMVRRGDLRAIKFGERGTWRIERAVLDEFVETAYAAGAAYVQDHPTPA